MTSIRKRVNPGGAVVFQVDYRDAIGKRRHRQFAELCDAERFAASPDLTPKVRKADIMDSISMPMVEQCVYILSDHHGVAYIGVTNDIYRRISEHRRHLGCNIIKIECIPFYGRDDAERCEIMLIKKYKPRFNTVYAA